MLSYFTLRHSRSTNTLSIQRPLPSMLMRTPWVARTASNSLRFSLAIRSLVSSTLRSTLTCRGHLLGRVEGNDVQLPAGDELDQSAAALRAGEGKHLDLEPRGALGAAPADGHLLDDQRRSVEDGPGHQDGEDGEVVAQRVRHDGAEPSDPDRDLPHGWPQERQY